jgi:hypothetical protein
MAIIDPLFSILDCRECNRLASESFSAAGKQSFSAACWTRVSSVKADGGCLKTR